MMSSYAVAHSDFVVFHLVGTFYTLQVENAAESRTPIVLMVRLVLDLLCTFGFTDADLNRQIFKATPPSPHSQFSSF